MKTFSKILTLAIIATIFSGSTFAQTIKSDTAIAGAGTTSCGDFVSMRRTQPTLADNIFTPWVQGYLSGVNTTRMVLKQVSVNIPEPKTIGLLLENSCISDPTASVWIATVMLTKNLIEKSEGRR